MLTLSPTHTLRSRLFRGTALTAALALAPQVAHGAAALPQMGIVANGTVTGTGLTLSGNGTAATPFVNTTVLPGSTNSFVIGTTGSGVAGQSAVINWGSFNIGATTVATVTTRNAVNFTGADGLAFSVLNRVTAGGSPTTIAGSLTGGGNGTIFVINEAGISFANSASVTNLSGLVASSLGVTDADFANFGTTTGVRFTGSGTGAITVDADAGTTHATIAPGSVLLLVAPQLAVNGGALSATGGDVGFVLASDATIALNPTSIISIRVDAGTPLATAQTLAGTVNGQRILVAAASSADMMGTLLGVSADLNATTATATDHGIVIAVGRNVAIDASNSISFAAPDTEAMTPGAQFRAGVSVTGSLSSSGRIDAGSTGDAAFLGGIIATGDLAVGAGGNVTIASGSSMGNVDVSGQALTLGVDGATAALTAGPAGTLHLTGVVAGDTAITTLGNFTLSAGGAVTIESAAAVPGNVSQNGSLAITGSAVSLGNIASNPAMMLAGSGDVVLTANGAAGAGSITAGTIVAQGAVTLSSINDTIAFAGATSGSAAMVGHDVTFTASGTASASDDIVATGNVVGMGTTLTLGSAGQTHMLMAGSTGGVTLTASDTSAAAITVLGNYAILGGAAVALQHADSSGADVTHDDTLAISGASVLVGDIALAAPPLPMLIGTGNVTLMASGAAGSGAVTAGAVTARNAVVVSSANDAVILGGATSGTEGTAPHGVTVTAGGDATVNGAIMSAGNVAVTASGNADVIGAVTAAADYTVVGHGVTLASNGATQSAAGDVLVQSGSNIFASGTLVADSGGTGGRRLVLDASSGGLFDSATGPVSLIAGNHAVAPTATNRSDIFLSFAAGHNLALGTVDANTFSTAKPGMMPTTVADYTPTVDMTTMVPTLITDGAITTAAITTIQSLTIGSTGTAAGARDVTIGGVKSAGGSVEVYATNGDVTLTGPVSAHTFANLHADAGTLSLGDVFAFGGDATLTGDAAIVKASGAHVIAASGNVLFASPGAVTADTVRAGGMLTVEGLTAGSSAASLTAGSLGSNGNLTITTAGSIDLSSGMFATIETNALSADLSGFTGAAIATPASLTLTSTAGAVTANGLNATGNLAIAAALGATIAGAVTAGADYTVVGGTVALGATGTTQSAVGNVLIRSTTGDLSVVGTLTADSGGTGTKALVLDSFGAIGGGGNLESGTAMTGSSIGLRVGTGEAIVLGTITADSLASVTAMGTPTSVSDYSVPSANTLTTSGAVTLGAVATTQANAIGTTGGATSLMVGGDTSTTGSVTLSSSSGGLSVTGIVSAATSATLSAPLGSVAAGTVEAFDGDAMLVGKTAITTGGTQAIAASGNVTLQSDGAITVGAVRSGGTANAGGLSTMNAASFTADSFEANGTSSVDASGNIVLTGFHAGSGTLRQLIAANLGGFTGPATAADSDFTLASSGGSVSAAALSTTGTTVVAAASSAAVAGTVTAGDAMTAAGAGNYRVTGNSITLGGTGVVQSATGSITLAASGTVVADTLRSPGLIAIDGLAPMTVPTSFTGIALQSNDNVTVATTGALTLTGTGAGESATLRRLFDPTTRTFIGPATAADADLMLSSSAGTIRVADAAATGNIYLTSSTDQIVVSGTLTAGDLSTAAGNGNIVLDGMALASLADATAIGAITVTSHAADATIGTAMAGGTIAADALNAALVTNGTAGGDVTATSHSTTGGSAAITSANAHNITAVAQFGPASIGNGRSLVSGDITATVLGGGNLASITTATANGGNVVATQSGSGNASVGSATASGSVRALATGGRATIASGTASGGNVDAAGTTSATITQGMAPLGYVRATATTGLATITSGTAGQSVVANGVATTIGTATAGDDIVELASGGNASATSLTVTGAAATEAAATDANGAALTFGGAPVTGLGGSNVIIRATGTASVGGTVAIAQANAAATANYDIAAGAITLGTAGTALNQAAAGRVDLTTTSGDVTFANTNGSLTSNFGGARTANALADMTTAGGGLTIASAAGVAGATTALVAATKTLPTLLFVDTQARQPAVMVTASPGGGGSIDLASVTGGAVTIAGPAAIAVASITASGDVAITGVAASGNDTASVGPTAITIDGHNAGYARVNVTAAGGAGADISMIGAVNGGQIGALQVLADTGAATLGGASSDPTLITSILVESQTSVAGILNPAGGAASSANPNTVAAQSIVLRGAQAGSSVVATGPLLATGSVTATAPIVTLGTVLVAGTDADGPGDIIVAASTSASLAAGPTETAVARRTINLTGGIALLGDGTASGGTLAVSGSTVTVNRRAVAGDDVILTSSGNLTATNAVVTTTGAVDLQAGDDTAPISVASIVTASGTGYGAGHTVETNGLTTAIDTVTGGNLIRLAGANIVATAGGSIDLSHAVVTAASGGLQRDIHIEAAGTLGLGTTTASRELVVDGGGALVATGTLAAGDDLVIASNGTVDVHGATLSTTGSATGQTDARRADGSLISVAAAGGALTNFVGSNIAIAATGPVQLGSVATTGASPSSLRVFSNADITTTQPLTTSGSINLVGATVSSPSTLTAGDDVVLVARNGAATVTGALMTTGLAASGTLLVDLAGNGIALPGEAALGRVDGSSILVAATAVSTVAANVTSTGRYSVYGRGGIVLGTAGAGTLQSAAGDVLLEASIGAAPAPASVTLADGLVLTANSDGVEAVRAGGFVAEPLVIRIGNGSVVAAGATLRALRTPAATLADQGTVQIQPVMGDGVASIAVQTVDSASADLRALGNVVIGSADVDAGLTLGSKSGSVALTTLTVGTAVPLMTAAQVNAIDVKLSGATGATLGTIGTGVNLVRDITVATVAGDASLTTAQARDDIIVTSATGRAIAGDLTFAGVASDSEGGVAAVAATDVNGLALPDPYVLTGSTITGLAGRNVVVSGAAAASLNSVTTAASDSLGDVRVETAAGPATLTTVNTGGAGLPARVIVATRNGVAMGTALNASGDIIVDATAGSAVLTAGNAGRDGIVVAPTVAIGSLVAGDDIVAVATGGTLAATTLTSTGSNSTDGITTVFRADGTSIVDPVAGGIVGGLAGGNVIALATGDATVTTALATAAAGMTNLGLVRIASAGGAVGVGSVTATAGDVVLAGNAVTAMTVSAGRDASVDTLNAPVSGLRSPGSATIFRLTAGRDATINTVTANLSAGGGLIAAQRNLNIFAMGSLTIETARAGGMFDATGASVTATDLESGDALTILARSGAATITTAASTGLPLLADFSGFAASGIAPGSTRNVSITAIGAPVSVITASAVDTLTLMGDAGVTLQTGSANVIDVASSAAGATITTAAAGEDFTVSTKGDTTVQQATAGRDATLTVAAPGALNVARLTAGHDIAVTTAGQSALGTAGGLIAAQRNITLSVPTLTVGVARAGGTLTISGTSLTATTLASGDALAVTESGNATINTAISTGQPLLADFSGFAVTGTAAGTTRNITVDATGAAMVTTAVAVHSISISGASATATTATANTGDTDGDLTITGTTGGASLGTGSARDVLVSTTAGDVIVGTATALRDIVLTTENGTASLATASSGRDTRVIGSNVSVVSAAADTAAVGGDLVLVATGNAVLGQGSARDILITAGGKAAATTATASRDLIMSGSSVTLDVGTAGRNIALTGVNGTSATAIDVTSATADAAGAGGVLQIDGNATLQFGSGFDVDVSGPTVALTEVTASHDITAFGSVTVTASTLTAGHNISVTGNAVAITTATANTGGTDGDLRVASTQGDADLMTGSGRDVRVTAINGGSASAVTATATRDLFVDVGSSSNSQPGTASLGTGAAGRDVVVVGPSVTIGSATAAANVVAVANAGTITATTLTSTGASSGDGLATIARADGTPVIDPTLGGAQPVGGLAGNNVIALGSGGVTVTTATQTAAAGATAPGLIRIASLGGITTATTATATGGVAVAGTGVSGGTLSAGGDATITATGGDTNLSTVSSGGNLTVAATNDVVVGNVMARNAALTAGRDINLAAMTTGDALDAGAATLTAGRDIIAAHPISVTSILMATAGGMGRLAGTNSGAATTISTQGNLTLAAATVATGALKLASNMGSIFATSLSGNGVAVSAGNAITTSGGIVSTGALSATGGSLAFSTVSSTLDATLHATGAIMVGVTSIGGALTASSDTGAIQTAGLTTGGLATITAGDATNGTIMLASLTTTGNAILLAGQSAAVTGLAQTSGTLTATATNSSLTFGAIGAGGSATLRSRTPLTVNGQAMSGGTLDALSSAGAVQLGSVQAATVTLRGATGLTVLNGTAATGPVTLTADTGAIATGDIATGGVISVKATSGAAVIASVSRSAALTITAATDATVAGGTNSTGDTLVTATGGSVSIGSVGSTGKLTLAAANNATIGGDVQTSGDTLVTATGGSAMIGGAVHTANYTINADTGTITLGSAATATQSSSGTVTLDSQALALKAGLTLAAKRIELGVTGAATGVSLGDGAGAAIGASKYTLSNANLRQLQSPVLELSAAALPVAIGQLNLDGVANGGITSAFGIRTTGDIRIADQLTFTSASTTTPRVLTLGGAAGGGDLDVNTTTAIANSIEVVALPGLDNSKAGTGGQIDAAGSTVQLRANYIALGQVPDVTTDPGFISALLPTGGTPLTTALTRSLYVDNANSSLYVAIPPYSTQPSQALIQAGTLVLAPGQWALIQNTGPTTTPGGGIVAATLKFTKVAGPAAADPEIAVFGSVAGKTGIASAISIDGANLDGISPNNIRVNGCVALSSAGCIQSAIAIPLINLADPGRTLLISSAPDLALSVELITGATNEALWREDDDAPGQNRPQRESRP